MKSNIYKFICYNFENSDTFVIQNIQFYAGFTVSVLALVQEEAHLGCQFWFVLIELYLPVASRSHLDMPCPWI